MLHEGLDGLTSAELLAVPDDVPHRLGITAAVSPLRLNGMAGMLRRIKRQVARRPRRRAHREPGRTMTTLRVLLPGPAEIGDTSRDADGVVQALADLYAYPDPTPPAGWVRASMICTLDGSATGPDGLSGSIGGPADRAVLSALRGLADVVAGRRRDGPGRGLSGADRETGLRGTAPAGRAASRRRTGDRDPNRCGARGRTGRGQRLRDHLRGCGCRPDARPLR